MEDILSFIDDNGEEIRFEVLEETRINNTNYILVAEDGDGDEATVYIMKDVSEPTSEEASYVIVDDDTELESVMKNETLIMRKMIQIISIDLQ